MSLLTEYLSLPSGLAMILTFLTLLACVRHAGGGESVYYVSPAGHDAWSGRLAEPNGKRTDGPWKTLAKAFASAPAAF